jgi:hypothetical protein
MRLLPKEPLRRYLQQHVVFTDPLTNEKIELKYATVESGENKGCPVVEIKGRLVMWELKDLAFEAVKLFRKEGIIPSGTPEQIVAEKERVEKGYTVFSPVHEEDMK